MVVLDWAFLGVLTVSLLLGLWRGLTYEIVTLAAWVAAFFAAQWFSPWMADRLPVDTASEPVRYAVGFVVTFVVTLFAGGLLAVLAKKMMHAAGLSPVDRMLGAAFGLTRGVLFLLAFAVVVNLTPLKEGLWWRESVGAGVATVVLQGLKPVMPAQFGSLLP